MKNISPYIIIVLSFLSIIFVGGILLILPISKQAQGHLSFVDALFVSTSAVTITGLSLITELDLRSMYGSNILLIERNNKILVPNKDSVLRPKDEIFIFGRKKDLPKVISIFNK